MADAALGNRPSVRYFCHRCNIYMFEDIVENYTCPFCESGFLEKLENGADRPSQQSQTFSDANMSNTNDANNRGNTNRRGFTLNNVPNILQDVVFLMSGNRLSEATRHRLRNEVRSSMLSRRHGNRPPGARTLGFLRSPGDYVFGGEALDAVVTQLMGQLEYSGAPPMPRDILSAIPSEPVTEEQAAANMSCSVCWDNFLLGEMVSRLECEHIFHSSCINPWLELHATCPVCRCSLLPANHRPEPRGPAPASDGSTTTTSSSNTTTNTTTHARPPRHLTFISPRVVIHRSTHPMFRRGFHTHTWDSPRDMSTSSDSSASVTSDGRWAPQTQSDTSTDSSSSVNRTQNYHTDFDCD
ncbi:E3 ubiquitin-protein ligase RNF126 [Pieris napi]|uniref:E3 ubiquitin-protein ligase RNF126 n=1 Tax=Pieris napi TaxID=78633 RepID=UPI001FBA0C9B|nr:E3 ubiquitin-protein ligase RNF126 [Pieris napi]